MIEAASRGLGVARVPRHLVVQGAPLVTLACDLGAFVPRVLYAVRPAGRAPRRVRIAIDWVARHAPA